MSPRFGIEDCPHRPPCPGCPRYAETGPSEAVARRLAELVEAAGARELLPLRVETLRAGGHRHRARLMIRGRASSPKIGLFQEGTHRIADIPQCRVHHPLINEIAAAARRAIRESGAQPFADRPHLGLLRALQVVIERASGRAQVVVVANASTPESSAPFCEALARAAGSQLHSLWWNGNPERTNVILGQQWQRLAGAESTRELFGGVGVHYPPDAFGQSHLALAERLSDRIAEWVPEGSRIVEFYAGSGAIGLRLLLRARELVFNERAPGGLRGLELGLAERSDPERERARVVAGAAGACAELARGAEVVIADPPRRGLDAELLRAICEAPPQRFLYASCGLDAFARELPELCAPGRLRLAALEVFDLFPFTAHVETLARFERA